MTAAVRSGEGGSGAEPVSRTGPWLDRRVWIVGAGLLAVNLAIKLHGLEGQGLWFDEAVSIRNAREPIDLARRMASDASPPLYGLLLSSWLAVWGDSLAAARSLSAVLSSMTAVGVLAIGSRFLSVEAGLVAASLFTTARAQLFFAQEARPYALVGLLCVASYYAFLELFRRPSRSAAWALAIANAALLYAHYVAGLALVAQILAALAAVRTAPRALRLYVASQVATALLFAPCAIWVVLHWPPPMSGWAVAPTPDRMLYVLDILAGSPILLVIQAVIVGLSFASGAGAIREVAASGRMAAAPSTQLVLALWLLVPLAGGYLVSQAVPVFLHRYLLFASLGLVLLVGRGVWLVRARGAARALLACALIALSVVVAARQPLSRPDWRGAAEIVRSASGPRTVAIVSPPYQVLPFAFHLSPAAFADPERMVDRLAEERVLGLTLAAAVDVAPRLAADRLVLAVSEEFAPVPADLVPRLAGAGFALAAERRLDRVAVLTFERQR
jgi:uncharacterized membrane protein